MQRTKLIAVATALLAATAAAVVLAGGASAASWHSYQGDLYAGHAYALQVPHGAESVEVLFEGAGSAAFAIHGDDGARIGFFELAPGLTSAVVAEPEEGALILYVYDLQEGALRVRVAAEDAPPLDLQRVELARDEVELGTFEPGPLDKVAKAELEHAPVFVTLLYEGSAKNLDATVASQKGAVVTVSQETASAFSPGVWLSQVGQRSFDGENLDGTVYTVELHAAAFEGRLVLTTLSLDIPASWNGDLLGLPLLPPAWSEEPEDAEEPTPPQEPEQAPAARPTPEMPGSAFELPTGSPIAFGAAAGTLRLALSQDEEHAHDGEHSGHGRGWAGFATVLVYDPSDTLVGVYSLDADAPTAEVPLAVSGEYVAYTWSSTEDAVLAALASGAPVAARELALAEERLTFTSSGAFSLAQAPVWVALRFDEGLGALADAELSNAKGVVAATHEPLPLMGAAIQMGSTQWPDHYAAGAHEVTIDGIHAGELEIVVLTYVRGENAPVTPEEAAEPEQGERSLPFWPF